MKTTSAAVTLGIVAALGSGLILANSSWAAEPPPDPMKPTFRCVVPPVGPLASWEAARASAIEACKDQIDKQAEEAARNVGADANNAARLAGLNTRYKGVYTCANRWAAMAYRGNVPFVFFGTASGQGECILNAVEMKRNH